jgi:hypothetical protein
MLYRLTDGPREGMTGTVWRWYADDVLFTLTCQPETTIKVPRAWIEPVDPTPMSAADARRVRVGAG